MAKKKKKKKTKGSRSALKARSLPETKKEPVFDLAKYTTLIYGREKIGKTTFFSTFPDALFLTTEPGTHGQNIFEFNHEDGACRDWSIVREAVDLLEHEPKRFEFVIVDTVDRAYDMCMDWVCSQLGIDHPGVDSAGEQDFGKSWKAVKQEFMSIIHRILRTGRGLCFTSHASEVEIKSRSGDKYSRIFPSMSKQARTVVEALVDLFFYAEYVRCDDGSTGRILITKGDETIWAGHRKLAHELPRFIPLTEEGGHEILQAAFEGEDVGVDATTFMAGRNTSETAKKFMKKEIAQAEKAKAKKKTSKKKSKKKSSKKSKKKTR